MNIVKVSILIFLLSVLFVGIVYDYAVWDYTTQKEYKNDIRIYTCWCPEYNMTYKDCPYHCTYMLPYEDWKFYNDKSYWKDLAGRLSVLEVSASETDWMYAGCIQVDVSDYSFEDYQKFINKNSWTWNVEYKYNDWDNLSIIIPEVWGYGDGEYWDNRYTSASGLAHYESTDDLIGYEIVLAERDVVIKSEETRYPQNNSRMLVEYLETQTETLVYSKSNGMSLEVTEGDSVTYYKINTIYVKHDRIGERAYLPGWEEEKVPIGNYYEGQDMLVETPPEEPKLTELDGNYNQNRWDYHTFKLPIYRRI